MKFTWAWRRSPENKSGIAASSRRKKFVPCYSIIAAGFPALCTMEADRLDINVNASAAIYLSSDVESRWHLRLCQHQSILSGTVNDTHKFSYGDGHQTVL
jgi:hypothetical protein